MSPTPLTTLVTVLVKTQTFYFMSRIRGVSRNMICSICETLAAKDTTLGPLQRMSQELLATNTFYPRQNTEEPI